MSRESFKFLWLFAGLLFIVNAGCGAEISKTEQIKKTLHYSESTKTREFNIDNINGSITVVGENRDDVALLANRMIRARSEEKYNEAVEKVKLDIANDDGMISVYVAAPYRKSDGSVNYRGYHHEGYEVKFDFEVSVPAGVNVFLKTVNDGDISVEKVAGNFDVKNINGSIKMTGLTGSGKAYALNGKVDLEFAKNPTAGCYIGSLNGNINIEFQSGLQANLLIKTFNGDVYSDFAVTYLPYSEVKQEKKGSKRIWKTGKKTKVRVGAGGPEIELDGFNGDINIHKVGE